LIRLLGLETEYGITVEGRDAGDLLVESMELVRAYPGPHAKPWDYHPEDPRRDARGYQVRHLTRSPDDDNYRQQDAKAPPVRDQRSDRVLANGARLYNDHGHPEYATPECASVLDLVAHDRAGERILLDCVAERERQTGKRVRLYKNNSDHFGVSYGTHENYLSLREVPFEALLAGLLPFLVTRQIYAGAGKIGVEQDGASTNIFQLSQRADFFTEVASVDTLHRRPIFNTRDEPHADPARFRRLHVICGDANPSEFATALKVGATAMALALVEEGWSPGLEIREPVRTIKDLSRDQTHRWMLETMQGAKTSAVEVQRLYLAEAHRRYQGRDPETDWLLMAWDTVLRDLEEDVFRLVDRLDWVAKLHLLEEFRESESLAWDDPMMLSLDLEYASIDRQEGLYWGLVDAGQMRQVVGSKTVADAAADPPKDTRAALRGLCVRRFPESIASVCWSRLWLRNGDGEHLLDLSPLAEGVPPRLLEEVSRARSVSDLLQQVQQGARRAETPVAEASGMEE
jgi:proteasome accessory factor A